MNEQYRAMGFPGDVAGTTVPFVARWSGPLREAPGDWLGLLDRPLDLAPGDTVTIFLVKRYDESEEGREQ